MKTRFEVRDERFEMVFRTSILPLLLIWAVGGIFVSSAHADEPRATATLRPAEISLGESVQLNVAIEGAATAAAPIIPSVEGLEFNHVGQSTQLQFINGKMSGGITHMYRVTSSRSGSFTIPAIKARVGDKILQTNPVVLRVEKSASSFSVPTAPSPARQSPSSPTSDVSSQAVMIRLISPKRDFFVGELVPVEIKLYLRHGIQASNNSLPVLNGAAFTLGKLSNRPERAEENINGFPYTVFTWHTAVAAVKPGEHPLGTQMQIALILGGDPFERLFGRVQEKQGTLQSPEETVKVLPLPTEGRPADFSGAVGQFQISASASPTQIAVGDPVTLKMTVSGTGNFDRLSGLTLESTDGWKTYPPSAKFEPTDEIGYSGKKVFEQALIPQKTDIKNVPPVKLSYFDPEARKYATLSSSPLPLQVSAVLLSSTGTTIPLTQGGAPRSLSFGPRPPTTEELVPNKMNVGHLTPSLHPIILNPWFQGAQSLPLCALALTWAVARRRARLAGDPGRARAVAASRAVRAQFGAMDAALCDRDTPAFFTAARRMLQERLGENWNIKPETIALSDIETRLPGDLPLTHDVRKVFETADAVAYSGQTYSSEALNEWRKAVLETLKGLEKRGER